MMDDEETTKLFERALRGDRFSVVAQPSLNFGVSLFEVTDLDTREKYEVAVTKITKD